MDCGKASLREIFDAVKSHLLKQNARSQGLDGRCLYRSVNGRKCAVGCLIDDDKYETWLEFRSALDLEIMDVLNLPETAYDKIRLLSELQKLHDSAEPELWPGRLGVIEKNFFESSLKNW